VKEQNAGNLCSLLTSVIPYVRDFRLRIPILEAVHVEQTTSKKAVECE
jgi:hypothetical protein